MSIKVINTHQFVPFQALNPLINQLLPSTQTNPTRPLPKKSCFFDSYLNHITYQTVNMKFSIAIAAIFTGVALSVPVVIEQRQAAFNPCSGLYGSAQCCATDVLGLLDLDCANRMFPSWVFEDGA